MRHCCTASSRRMTSHGVSAAGWQPFARSGDLAEPPSCPNKVGLPQITFAQLSALSICNKDTTEISNHPSYAPVTTIWTTPATRVCRSHAPPAALAHSSSTCTLSTYPDLAPGGQRHARSAAPARALPDHAPLVARCSWRTGPAPLTSAARSSHGQSHDNQGRGEEAGGDARHQRGRGGEGAVPPCWPACFQSVHAVRACSARTCRCAAACVQTACSSRMAPRHCRCWTCADRAAGAVPAD